MLILSGHLPHFSADKRKVARAANHQAIADFALELLDARIALDAEEQA